MQKHFLILLGTRPEAIKLFPLINLLKAEKNSAVTVCATAQHRELLDQVLKLANIVPDFDLNIMTANQTLNATTVLKNQPYASQKTTTYPTVCA